MDMLRGLDDGIASVGTLKFSRGKLLVTVSSIVSVILCMIQPANKDKQHWLVTSHDKDIKLHAPRMLGHPPLLTLFVFLRGPNPFFQARQVLGRFCESKRPASVGPWHNNCTTVPTFSRSTVEQGLFGLTWHILTPSPPQCPTFARWLVDLLICLLECESSVWLASVAWLLHDRMILAHTCWPGHCQDKKQWKAYGS